MSRRKRRRINNNNIIIKWEENIVEKYMIIGIRMKRSRKIRIIVRVIRIKIRKEDEEKGEGEVARDVKNRHTGGMGPDHRISIEGDTRRSFQPMKSPLNSSLQYVYYYHECKTTR